MLNHTLLSAFSALFSIAVAVPFNQRDLIMVTETQETILTIPVTTTIWLNPGETAPTPAVTTTSSSSVVSSTVPAPSPVIASSSKATPSSIIVVSSSAPAPTTLTTSVAPVVPSPTTVIVPTTSTSSSVFMPSTFITSVSSTAPAAPAAPTQATTASTPPSTSQGNAGSAVDAVAQGLGAAGTEYVGELTWYQTGMGACGFSSSSTDDIVAISHVIFDSYGTANPNANPLCKQYVEITGADGNMYPAQIVDRCVGCAMGDLDLSESFFNKVTSNGDGRVPGIHWRFG